MPIELFLLSALRAVVELTAFILLGQGILFILAGKARHENFVYQMFGIITRPVVRFTRMVTPRLVRDEHIPFAAFLLLVWVWLGLAFAKRYLCVAQALNCTG